MGQPTINKKLLGICEFQGESGNPFACPNVSFEVDNTDTSAVARLLALSTGWYDNASEIKDLQGHSVDAILKDGEVIDTTNKKVTATGKNCIIADTVKMLKSTPCRIKGIKLSADDTEQLDCEIQVLKLTPNGPQVIARIIPSSSKDDSSLDAKRVSVDLSDTLVMCGEDVVILLNVAAGHKCSYTFYYENRASFRAMIENQIYNGENL